MCYFYLQRDDHSYQNEYLTDGKLVFNVLCVSISFDDVMLSVD